MKEPKDDPMLTDLALRQAPIGALAEPSLSVLAEHLCAIAEALRRTDGRDGVGRDGVGSIKGRLNTVEAARASLLPSLSATSLGDRGIDSDLQPVGHPTTNNPDAKLQRAIFADLARHAYATRRRRSAIFKNDELFGEPAWDILLDLYIAHAENKAVSVSSACIGSAAPPTTGLRWLGVLSEQGLILREHDPEDQRRVLVRLTDTGLAAMDEHFASAGVTA